MDSGGRIERCLAVVSAHVGDFSSRSGGTLAIHSKAGWRVEVICLSFGERGESPGCWALGLPEPEVKKVRRREGEASASVLGAHVEFADWGDQPVVNTRERIERLVSWMRRVRPQVLLTHYRADPWNPDHETAFTMARDASYFASRAGVPGGAPIIRPHLYCFEPTWPFASQVGFAPNVYVDVTPVMETKLAAIKCLATQPEMVERYHRVAKARGDEAREGQAAGIEYAEAFHRIDPWVGGQLPSEVGPQHA